MAIKAKDIGISIGFLVAVAVAVLIASYIVFDLIFIRDSPLSESSYAALMGAFVGSVFGLFAYEVRIFRERRRRHISALARLDFLLNSHVNGINSNRGLARQVLLALEKARNAPLFSFELLEPVPKEDIHGLRNLSLVNDFLTHKLAIEAFNRASRIYEVVFLRMKDDIRDRGGRLRLGDHPEIDEQWERNKVKLKELLGRLEEGIRHTYVLMGKVHVLQDEESSIPSFLHRQVYKPEQQSKFTIEAEKIENKFEAFFAKHDPIEGIIPKGDE